MKYYRLLSIILFVSSLSFASSELLHQQMLPYGSQTIEGTIILPEGKIPTNTDFTQAVKACVTNPYARYGSTTIPECAAEFSDFGFAFLFTRHMGHRMVGYISTTYMHYLHLGVQDIELHYNDVENSIAYSIQYSVFDSQSGSSMYSPGAPAGSINMGIVWNGIDEDGVEYSFNGFEEKVEVTIENTNWIDIHLKVNGGPQLNYRMDKDNFNYKHDLQVNVQNGDVIEFFLTHENTDGLAYNTETFTLNVTGVSQDFNNISDNFYSGQFSAFPIEQASWVVVHYSVDGSTLFNHEMNVSGENYFTWPINEVTITSGQKIHYFYTFEVDGVGYDSRYKTITVP